MLTSISRSQGRKTERTRIHRSGPRRCRRQIIRDKNSGPTPVKVLRQEVKGELWRKAMKFDFIPDSVSHFDNAYDVLKERGFIEQSTNEEEIQQTAAERKS